VRERLFVLIANNIQGIVTRADLQKPPVRVLLFGFLSLFEMHLSHWIQRCYPNDTWRTRLNPSRLEGAHQLWEERKARNEEISEFECLQFCDKRELVLANREIRERLGLGSKTAAGKLLRRAERQRDKIAHSQMDLETGDSWSDIIQMIRSIEKAIHESDTAIEAAAELEAARQSAVELA
jgi:hypothetical protein